MASRTSKGYRIYMDTYIACKAHLKAWGAERNADGTIIGFERLYADDNICVRTLNSVQCEIDYNLRIINECEKIGISDWDDAHKRLVIEMVQSTLNNTRKWLERVKN